MCCVCLYIAYRFAKNISQSKKKWAIYYHKFTQVFMQSARYFFHILIELEFSQHIFLKNSNIRFHDNSSTESWVVLYRRTDRHDEENSRFSQKILKSE